MVTVNPNKTVIDSCHCYYTSVRLNESMMRKNKQVLEVPVPVF
nr:MAG TPA: hypothetical protein [Caudoviricetes sp.]